MSNLIGNDWSLFWTAFGAIGGTLGAIATFIAVVVALWQTKLNYKKKLILSFTTDIVVAGGTGNIFYRFVGMILTNVGNRDIFIQNWGFLLNNGERVMIVLGMSSVARKIQVELPHKLQIEEGTTLFYEKDLFHTILKEYIEEGKLYKNRKIKFYVADSTGAQHYVLSKKTANELLNELEIEKAKREQTKLC